jgi:hypothetical protein
MCSVISRNRHDRSFVLRSVSRYRGLRTCSSLRFVLANKGPVIPWRRLPAPRNLRLAASWQKETTLTTCLPLQTDDTRHEPRQTARFSHYAQCKCDLPRHSFFFRNAKKQGLIDFIAVQRFSNSRHSNPCRRDPELDLYRFIQCAADNFHRSLCFQIGSCT